MNNTLKNKLKTDYEKQLELPSYKLWGKIEEQLLPVKKTSKINYWKIAAVMLLLITIGVIYQYQLKPKAVSTPQIVLVKKEPLESNPIDVSTKKNVSKEQESEAVTNFVKMDKKKENIIVKDRPLPLNDLPRLDVIENNKIVQNSETVAPSKPVKYITAEDLLFEREVQKTMENKEKPSKMVHINGFEKPKQISLLGITLYDESK